jgi:hypothetical protein
MTFDIDQIYKNLLGRGVKDEGNTFWTGQYNDAIKGGASSADAISGIEGAIKQSDEYSTPFATHRRAAMDSISKGQGVRDGTVASYSDMYNADGTKRSDWVDEKTWLQNKVYSQHNQIQDGGSKYDDSALLSQLSGLTGQLGDLRSAFDEYKKQSATDMQNMWNNANWGYGGQTVGGVRTQNELPGWGPKRGGTSGFFGRGGRSGKGLTTSSLNI